MKSQKRDQKLHAKLPPPGENEKRCIFNLDPLQRALERDERMLELIPGRVEVVDGVNHYCITGSIAPHELEGLDCSYYKVTLGATDQTRMSCPPDMQPVQQFVPLAERELIQYNSKLPVVVYLPSEAELRYRVWVGDGEKCVAVEH